MDSTAPAKEDADPQLVRAKARVGTTLRDKWRLISLLGIGGMASVFEATHRNGSRAAVKILHTELSSDRLIRERFLREGYAANLVGHDGAVKVLDDDTTDDGALFLVTELLEGDTLEELAHRRGGRLRWDELMPFVDQLLEVLAVAHEKGIVHRDIKPDNVFVTRAGRVKVLDFGIARLREVTSGGTTTQAGTTMGSPAYMSPEQARGLWDEVDHRTDLWAVGATMYTLLSGRLVHEGRTANELLLSAMTQHAPSLSAITADAPGPVVAVVDRALAFDIAARWPDAKAMREAVLAIPRADNDAGRTVIRVSRPSQPARATEPEVSTHPTLLALATGQGGSSDEALPRRRRRPALVAVAVGLVIGAVSLGRLSSSAAPAGRALPTPADTAGSRPVVLAAPVDPPPLPSAVLVEPSEPAPAVAEPPERSPAKAPVRSPALPSQAAPSAAHAAPPSKGACSPPYVIDPSTGSKKWKLECL